MKASVAPAFFRALEQDWQFAAEPGDDGAIPIPTLYRRREICHRMKAGLGQRRVRLNCSRHFTIGKGS